MHLLSYVTTTFAVLAGGVGSPDGRSTYITNAKRFREAAIHVRTDILALRRRLVDATVARHFASNLEEVEEYVTAFLNWPRGVFRLTCGEEVQDKTIDDLIEFTRKLVALIGHDARLSDVKKMSDFLEIEVSQLTLNLDVEHHRTRVLEGLMAHADYHTSDNRESCVAACASNWISAVTDLQRLVAARTGQVDAWCKNVGVCIPSFTPPKDKRLQVVAEHVEEQIYGSDQLLAAHFSNVVRLWGVLDNLALDLQDLQRRSEVVSMQMSSVEVLHDHIPLDWAENVTKPSMAPCGSTGMSVESTYHVLDQQFKYAVETASGLPSALIASSQGGDVCNVSFLALAWAEHVDIDTNVMASWHDMICERIRSISKVWEVLTALNSNLHAVMQQYLPDFRRRAFEEIYDNHQWAEYGSSGTGSQYSSTDTIAEAVSLLIQRRGIRVVLDLGCGWGEWLPPVLCTAVKSKRLPAGLHYIGWDIAQAPIEGVQANSHQQWSDCGIKWEFHVKDGVEVPIPDSIGLVIARHVMQHLSHRDSLSLLHNIRVGKPDFVLLSQTKGARNIDIRDSSSFVHVSKPNTPNAFDGYDVLREPFQLPRPLEELPESRSGTSMLLFRGSDYM